MSAPEIRTITAAETVPIRHAVLRAGLRRESAIFPGDDSPDAQHLGAFTHGEIIGVVSLFPAALPERPECERAMQLRGMATQPHARNGGVGSALLAEALRRTTASGATLLWCNARATAIRFYAQRGFRPISAEFDIPTAGPHLRMFVEC